MVLVDGDIGIPVSLHLLVPEAYDVDQRVRDYSLAAPETVRMQVDDLETLSVALVTYEGEAGLLLGYHHHAGVDGLHELHASLVVVGLHSGIHSRYDLLWKTFQDKYWNSLIRPAERPLVSSDCRPPGIRCLWGYMVTKGWGQGCQTSASRRRLELYFYNLFLKTFFYEI